MTLRKSQYNSKGKTLCKAGPYARSGFEFVGEDAFVWFFHYTEERRTGPLWA